MSITLKLSPETEDKLRKQARRAGLNAADYLARLIETAPEDADMVGASPAETVEYWLRDPYPIFEGLPDSPDFARTLRLKAEGRNGCDAA
jgi:hypothetical protein